MNKLWFRMGSVGLLCLGTLLGVVGCEDYDDKPPTNISGTWASTLTGTKPSTGSFGYQGTMTFVQDGQNVTGSYDYREDRSFTFSGTYVDGTLDAIDSDDWTMHIEFEETTGKGSMNGLYNDGTPGTEQVTLTR